MVAEPTHESPQPPQPPALAVTRVVLSVLLALPVATAVLGIVAGAHDTVVLVLTAAIGSSLAIIGFAMRGGFRPPGDHRYPELDMPDDDEFGAALRDRDGAEAQPPSGEPRDGTDRVDVFDPDSPAQQPQGIGPTSSD